MKKIFLTVMVALCTMGIVAAQDLEKATEIYNNAAAAIETNKAEAINLFEQALEKQIRRALAGVEGSFEVTREFGRVYVTAEGEYDFDGALDALRTVFGISGICPVTKGSTIAMARYRAA